MEREMEEKLLKDVKIEELPDEMQILAHLIGLENLFKLSHYANGSQIYIPVPETFLRNARNREIKREYNGFNCKEISKRWKITEEQVRKILRGYDPKQISIFDLMAEQGEN